MIAVCARLTLALPALAVLLLLLGPQATSLLGLPPILVRLPPVLLGLTGAILGDLSAEFRLALGAGRFGPRSLGP